MKNLNSSPGGIQSNLLKLIQFLILWWIHIISLVVPLRLCNDVRCICFHFLWNCIFTCFWFRNLRNHYRRSICWCFAMYWFCSNNVCSGSSCSTWIPCTEIGGLRFWHGMFKWTFDFFLEFHDLLQFCLMYDWSHSLLSPYCYQEFFCPSSILQIEGHAMLYVSFSVYYSSSLQLFGISPKLDDWIKLAVQSLGNATWILLIHCWCPGVNPWKVGW